MQHMDLPAKLIQPVAVLGRCADAMAHSNVMETSTLSGTSRAELSSNVGSRQYLHNNFTID
jgi:hypothetical protein